MGGDGADLLDVTKPPETWAALAVVLCVVGFFLGLGIGLFL